DIGKLFSENINTIKKRLWETAVNGWYSLNCPLAIEEKDVLQSITARCVQAALVMRESDLSLFADVGEFLLAVENQFADLGVRPISDSLRISAERLNFTISMCDDCRDPEMRNWYQDLLRLTRDNLVERIPLGYELGTGLPPDGNPRRWADT